MANVCFAKKQVVIYQPSVEICRQVWFAHRLLDILKAAISTNAKPEIVLLRFGRHIALSRWRPRPLNTISGFAFVDIDACRRSRSL